MNTLLSILRIVGYMFISYTLLTANVTTSHWQYWAIMLSSMVISILSSIRESQ
jgi:uncharacterized protein (DUF983 family)